MKIRVYDLASIAVLFLAILLLMNLGQIFPQASTDDCFSRERLKATMAGGVHLMVVEGRVYDISNWTNTTYPSGVALLAIDLSAEESAKLGSPLGVLCERELEDVNYSATIGVTDRTKDLVASLVNKTIGGLKEDHKRAANKDNVTYIGWHIMSRMILKEMGDFCDKDATLIFSDVPPDVGHLRSCGRRAFVAGGGNVSRVYIVRSNVSNIFFEPLLLEFNAMPGYERLERYTG